MNTGVIGWGCLYSLMIVAGGFCMPAIAQPVNDLFVNRAVVTGTSLVVTGSSMGASRETGEPYHAGNSGGASVWWSWTAPGSGFVTVSTAGSGFDTVLGVYTGTGVSTLTRVTANDDENYSGGIYTSKVYFDVTAGQKYEIAVDGYAGISGSVRLAIQMEASPVAPAWTLPDPYGALVNSSAYAGKVVILDFWATWCGPCKAEIPDFVMLQDKYREDGLVIVGASVDTTASVVVSFLGTFTPTVNYQVVMANTAVQQAYGGVSAIPTTFVIDRQNVIRKKWVGTQSGETLEKAIIPLLYCNACISCRPSAGGMELCWPATARDFALEYAATAEGAGWEAWPEAPTVVNGMNVVTVSATGAPRFFRLRMAY